MLRIVRKMFTAYYLQFTAYKLQLLIYFHLYFLPKLNELSTTLTLEKAIAALASIGFNNKPFSGNKTPAAIGIPIRL